MFASGPRAGELFWEEPFANSNHCGPLASGPAAFWDGAVAGNAPRD